MEYCEAGIDACAVRLDSEQERANGRGRSDRVRVCEALSGDVGERERVGLREEQRHHHARRETRNGQVVISHCSR